MRRVDDERVARLAPRTSLRPRRLRRRRGLRRCSRRLAEIERERPERGAQPPLLPRGAAERVRADRAAPVARAGSRRGTTTAEQRPWARVVVEKPFGREPRDGARRSTRSCVACFAEHQVYRIDHYLGQGDGAEHPRLPLRQLDLRAAVEPQYIHHVQITAAETVGRGGRAASTTRKRASCATCSRTTCCSCSRSRRWSRRSTLSADAVRDEKVKVLRSIRPLTPGDDSRQRGARRSTRPGTVDGKPVPGYREEPDVAPDSQPRRPTRAARFMIDNWRWQGVPFYLRSGKRLAQARVPRSPCSSARRRT